MSIYKFVSAERIDILKNLLIRFTQPIKWNDPMEMKPAFYQKEMDRITFDIDERGLMTSSLKIEKLINEELVSVSFSENLHNPIMWARYSNDYNGFVIEFDENNPFFHKTNNHFFKIPYSNIRPRLTLSETQKIVLKIIEIFSKNAAKDYEQLHKLEILFTKSIYWSEEKEWRLIALSNHATKLLNPYPYKATFTFDLNRETLDLISSDYIALFSVPPQAINSIYFGCRIKPLMRREIFDVIENNQELSHIRIFQTHLNLTDFTLDFKPINRDEIKTLGELFK